MKHCIFLLILILAISCVQKTESLEDIFNCEIDNSIYISHENYETKEFQLFYPRNWQIEITQDTAYTSYTFADSIPDLTDKELLEISDQEFDERYTEYDLLTITHVEKHPDSSERELYTATYSAGMNDVFSIIYSNKENQILRQGSAIYNGNTIKWIEYRDNSYNMDDLTNLTFVTGLEGKHHFFSIIFCVFGEKNIDERLCNLIGVINTITVK